MDQVARGQADSVEADAALTETSLDDPAFDIRVRYQPVLNQALLHNSVPMICELQLENRSGRSFPQIILTMSSDQPVVQPRRWVIEHVTPGQIRTVRDIDVKLDAGFVTSITEAMPCIISLTAQAGTERLAAREDEIRLLPPNFWGGTLGLPDILAAYAEPNDPAVAKILRAASDMLRAQNMQDSLEGYQTRKKPRVWEQASAIWGAICGLDIRYVNAPPSFEHTGQRIRPPRQIVEEKLANCLDASLLLAACLEAAGLHPLIVLIHGHAFAGVWYNERNARNAGISDPASLRNHAALGDLLLFESTALTQTQKPVLKAAQSAAMEHLDAEKDAEFDSVLDIYSARQRRIRPLPAVKTAREPAEADTGAPVAIPPIEEAPPLPDDVLDAAPDGGGTPLNRIDRWRQRLLDLTGRNRLLNLPLKSKQVLAIACPDVGKLEDMLAGMRGQPRPRPFRFIPRPELMSGADPRSSVLHRERTSEEAEQAFAMDALDQRELIGRADEASLQATLTEIYRAARVNQQEGGANTLFLTLGALLWKQKDRDKPYQAPLILIPVVLERQSVRSGFTLRIHDEETRLNATLFEMLRQDFGVQFPGLLENPPTDEAGWNVREILDTVRRKLRHIPGWEVTETASLTNLSFAKFLMWKDLTDQIETLRRNETVQLLLNEPASQDDAPPTSEERDAAPDLDRELAAANLVCPLEADSSQSRAVAKAASGGSFVMIGPPGTGKSQTIANIIANTLAQGRSVLFVAAKQTALEVVRRRLAQVGLADFCLDLFSPSSTKLKVLQQLERARLVLEAFRQQDWAEANAAADALRGELNIYVRTLHERAGNGWTPFRAMGVVLRAEDEGLPRLSLSWPRRDMHDAAAYRQIVELVEDAAASWARTGAGIGQARLAGIEALIWAPAWEQRLREAAREAVAALRKLEQRAAAVSELFGLPDRPSKAVLAARLALCGVVLEAAEADGGWALADQGAISVLVREEAARVKRHAMLAGSLTGHWQSGTPDRCAAWREAAPILRTLLNAAAQAAGALGLPVPASRKALDGLAAVSALLLEAPARQAVWAFGEDAPATLALLRQDAGQAGRHAALRKELAASWRPAAMALPLNELSAAWQEAAAKWLVPRKLALAALRKQLTPVIDGAVPEDCGGDLARLAEMQRIERNIEASEAATRIGGHWRGLETDFAALEAGYVWGQQLHAALKDCAGSEEFQARMLAYVRTLLADHLDMLVPDGEAAKAFRTMCSAHGACKAAAGGALPDDSGEELARLTELLMIETRIEASPLAALAGSRWRGLGTDFAKLEAGVAWAARLRDATATAVADPAALSALRRRLGVLVTEGADLLAPEGLAGQRLLAFHAAWDDTRQALDAVAPLCASAPATMIAEETPDWITALTGVFTGWELDARLLREWCGWRALRHKAQAAGILPVLDALAEGRVAPNHDAKRMFEAAYAGWWLNLTIDETPVLRDFAAATHEKRIQRFRDLDHRMFGLATRLIRLRLSGEIRKQDTSSRNPEYAVLNHELQKRLRHMPLRQLAAKMPRALRRLTPCLMMSPLSVAQFLPADGEPFDLVIFDEASQIATWDAVGALGRGRQVIVVGDQKQLPPSDFFQRQAAEDDNIEAGEGDLDSVLDECLGRGMPHLELSWHYRSRHESLIAFSNHTYYGGRLITFPSPVTADRAVSFRYVEGGVYARSGLRTNLIEARAVVAETVRRLRATFEDGGAPPSIGIVTFNAPQQSLIQDLLDEERKNDLALEPFFNDSAAEPVMIKNLEGVQGEERDVMLFSLTFGPDTAGKFAMNFGPLNNTGGERRLNVAVTRARAELVVFGSFRAEQMDLARTNAQGVRQLKEFIDYAERGVRALGATEATGLGNFDTPFEEAVAARLQAHGWEVRSQIGVSGYRIDLGVVDPDAAGRYLAGVECDGATYHRGATARDRDRLRQHVLETLGWRIERIWSTDWWMNAERETERLHGALNDLLAKSRMKRSEKSAPPALDDPIPEPDEPAVSSYQYAKLSLETPPPAPAKPELQPDPAAFYEQSYRRVLTALIETILTEFGPLRADVLAHLVARKHGFQHTGGNIRDRILAALPEGCAQTSDGVGRFIWPMGVAPESWSSFRAPAPGISRDPTEMPLQELVVLARMALNKNQEEEAALLAMRDACKLQRLRERSRNRCLEALALARR